MLTIYILGFILTLLIFGLMLRRFGDAMEEDCIVAGIATVFWPISLPLFMIYLTLHFIVFYKN